MAPQWHDGGMRAVICRELGPPETLEVTDVPTPTPGAGEVVVDVHGCGVNFADTLIIEGKYQFKPPLPFSPGAEVAGTVAAVGPDVESVAVGDRVMCINIYGGYAEQLLTRAAGLLPVPDGMDLPSASAFVTAFFTSYHALVDRGRLQNGETLLVLGAAGGVGLAAVQLGAALGARVIAAASTDAKLELCRRNGAAETINYADEDLRGRLKELTGGTGPDVIYDPVGGALSEPALRSIAWRGRFLVVGFAAGDIPRIPLNLALLKGCEIVGVFAGEFLARQPEDGMRTAHELGELFTAGKIRPEVSATYPLEQAAEAMRAIGAREVAGKIVVTTELGRASAAAA
jgi:NADPH:quinone reductase